MIIWHLTPNQDGKLNIENLKHEAHRIKCEYRLRLRDSRRPSAELDHHLK